MDETRMSSRPPDERDKFELMATEETMSSPLQKVEEKMDEDLLFFLTYIPIAYKNLKDEKEKELCKEWMRRLTGKRPRTAAGKRNRNIYIVNLILNMGDGKLEPPFNNPPPHEKLKPPRAYFGTIDPPQPCPDDLNLQIEDFSQVSKDGRTVFAARALPSGRGCFGYIGVSMGGADTVWLNSCGQPIDPCILNEIRESHASRGTCPETKFIEKLLQARAPSDERAPLLPFYDDLLCKIREVICKYGTDCEICDPVIEKMIEDLQMEALEAGTVDNETICCYTKLHWLQALYNKIDCQQQLAEKRQEELNALETSVSEKDELIFLDISKAVKSPKIDTMFAEAARDRPTKYNVELLKKNYPECVVQKLLELMEKEKLNIINQQRVIYQDFIMQIKGEIMKEVKRGLEKYTLARKEWHRVANVMRKIEEVKAKILQEVQRSSVGADPDFFEKDNVLNEELLEARKKLEDAKERNDKIDTRINNLHDQVHHLALEFEKMQDEGKRGNDQLAQEVSMLQREVRKQERKLSLLRAKVVEKEQGETCRRHSSSS